MDTSRPIGFGHAASLALRDLANRRTLAVLAKTWAVTLLVFMPIGYGVWRLLRAGIGHIATLDNDISSMIAALGTAFVLLFLFRVVAMAVMGLFTDGIVDAVERAHYPAAANRATPVGAGLGIRLGLRSALRALGWNLLALPGYVFLLLTGAGTLMLGIAVNALLLGKDLESMVVARHRDSAAMPLAWPQRWGLGLVVAIIFAIPFINLLAPIFGAALAVHLFHQQHPAPSDDRHD